MVVGVAAGCSEAVGELFGAADEKTEVAKFVARFFVGGTPTSVD